MSVSSPPSTRAPAAHTTKAASSASVAAPLAVRNAATNRSRSGAVNTPPPSAVSALGGGRPPAGAARALRAPGTECPVGLGRGDAPAAPGVGPPQVLDGDGAPPGFQRRRGVFHPLRAGGRRRDEDGDPGGGVLRVPDDRADAGGDDGEHVARSELPLVPLGHRPLLGSTTLVRLS